MALTFSWDRRKAAVNIRRHGVSFEEAVSAFGDSLSRTIQDEEHSAHEERYLLLGRTSPGRLVVVAHTERGNTIRLISARSATRAERRDYEDG